MVGERQTEDGIEHALLTVWKPKPKSNVKP